MIKYLTRVAWYQYQCDREMEIVDIAKKTTKVLGCRGYAGVDIVLADKPYVVDVNPRPTTSLIGITRIMKAQIADSDPQVGFRGTAPRAVKWMGILHLKRKNYLDFSSTQNPIDR